MLPAMKTVLKLVAEYMMLTNNSIGKESDVIVNSTLSDNEGDLLGKELNVLLFSFK